MLENIEELSAKFHEIYQLEAKRQGDVRHKDDYADLPDNIKEFDRVLARFVIQLIDSRVKAAEGAAYLRCADHVTSSDRATALNNIAETFRHWAAAISRGCA